MSNVESGHKKTKNHCIMGCGRSKQIQRNPRLVQPCDNNNFSNVIGGIANTSNEVNSGVLLGCCRRNSGNISRKQNDIDISAVKPTVEHLGIAAKEDISSKSIVDEAFELNSRWAQDPIASECEIFSRHISISSINIEKSLSKCATRDGLAIDSEGDEENQNVPLKNNINLPFNPPKPNASRSCQDFDDEEYRQLITECSSNALINMINESFEPPEVANLIAITGVGYQYIQEVYRMYPPNLQQNKGDSDNKSIAFAPIVSSSSGIDTSSMEPLSFLTDAKFIEDSGSRTTSGFVSESSSVNSQLHSRINSPCKRNELSVFG